MTDGWQQIAGLLDYPMFVVTTRGDDEPSGCLVGFATQVSIHPPRFLVGLSNKNRTYRVAEHAHRLVVHLLGADQHDLAELFGGTTGDEADKFTRCEWRDGPDGVPVLGGVPAWFSGPILSRHEVGDHVGFLLEVDAAEANRDDARLLTFKDVQDLEPGHEA